MYPIPEYFKINPKYLLGLDENEFIDGFHCLRNTVRDIYKDIIKNPESYGLPLTEDSVPVNSSRRLMDYLNVLSRAGELRENSLVVTFDMYNESLKTIKPKVSIAASNILIKRLTDFGFYFTGFNGKTFDKGLNQFVVTYEDNRNLIPVLKGYSMANHMSENRRDEFRACQYDLVAASGELPKQVRAYVFSQYLSGEQKDFFIRFNERMTEEGFTCETPQSHNFTLEYYLNEQIPFDKKPPHIVQCTSENNQLNINLVITSIPSYCGHIEKLPDRVKAVYKRAVIYQPCKNMESCELCGCIRKWKMDGEDLISCQFGNAHISDYNLDDIEAYISVIKLEAEANPKRYH
jgi:hypothetical protein